MKTYLNILYTLLAVTLLATSCRKDDGNTIIREVDFGYDIVPYTVSVGISPMTDTIDGIALKTTFATGDVIEISNPKLLLEPATLTSDDYIGKTRATFSGELKVRVGETLQSGSSTLTAALRNTAIDTLYNCGKPFFNVKEVSSLKKELDVYSYWACKNYTYTSSNASINIMQNTVFVQFDIPVNGANMTMTCGRSRCIKSVNYNTILALPFGTQIENEFLNISQKLDADSKFVYTINADVAVPEDCVPGLFSVAENKQVFFSKGNLQYRPYDGAWRLAKHQYDRCFKYAIAIGDNYAYWMGENDWSDLFGWGTWIKGGNPKNTSMTITDYNMPIDTSSYNLVGKCAFGSQWAVLTYSNWHYLIFGRKDAENKVGYAKILDTEGLVLLPDVWIKPDGIPDFMPGKRYDYTYTFTAANEYTTEMWAKMESTGAVFLPQTVHRKGSEIFNSYGIYWTATNYWNDLTYAVFLNLSDENMFSIDYLFKGGSVRLVYGLQYLPSGEVVTPDNPDDPVSDVDRCIIVSSKDNANDFWDSQFWIVTDGFTKGQHYELSMSIKADYEAKSHCQIHADPGSYNGELSNSNFTFTTEWSELKRSGTLDSAGRSIAFNLNVNRRANNYYFDNISLIIDGVEMVVNGDCSSDNKNSFLKKGEGDSYTGTFVTFIDKATIQPAKPREEILQEVGASVFQKDYTSPSFTFEYYDVGNFIHPNIDPDNGLIFEPPFDGNGNQMWYQVFVADNVSVDKGRRYSIEVEIRGEQSGSFNADMRWDWNEDPVTTSVKYSTEWETRRFYFSGPMGDSPCFIIFQPGDLPYKIYLKRLKVICEGD